MDMDVTNWLICFYGSIMLGVMVYIALTLRDISRAVSTGDRAAL